MLVPACCWIRWIRGTERGREGTHTSCSPFQIQKWRTDGAAAEKKRRIDNDSDVLRAFQLSPPPIPLFLPAHAAPSEQR